jgi:hypothetical protein
MTDPTLLLLFTLAALTNAALRQFETYKTNWR